MLSPFQFTSCLSLTYLALKFRLKSQWHLPGKRIAWSLVQKVLSSSGLRLLQSQFGGKTAGPHTSGPGKPCDSGPEAQAQKPGDPRPIPALPVSHSESGASLLAPLSGPIQSSSRLPGAVQT